MTGGKQRGESAFVGSLSGRGELLFAGIAARFHTGFPPCPHLLAAACRGNSGPRTACHRHHRVHQKPSHAPVIVHVDMDMKCPNGTRTAGCSSARSRSRRLAWHPAPPAYSAERNRVADKDLLFPNQNPGPDRQSNCRPSRDGASNPTFRLSWPQNLRVLTGSWHAPAVERLR